MRILDEESAGLGKGDVFSGETAFKLYDTYGFPLDLTQDALKPRGIKVDTERLRCGDGGAARRGAQGLEGFRARPRPKPSGSKSASAWGRASSSATTPKRRKA